MNADRTYEIAQGLRLPGGLPGGSPRDWRALQQQSDAVLSDALTQMVIGLRGGPFDALAVDAGLPMNEVTASPFGLRAVAMGVSSGATHVHRELTRVPQWAGDGRTEDPRHDTWAGGHLQTGKYQAFVCEGAHSIFDPSHIAKWGSHEMLHRACSFYWHDRLTRWQLYLGARLNELLPVALWYGADQVARLDENEFVRHASPHEIETPAPWLTEPTGALRIRITRTLPRFRHFLRHLEREFAAIDQELSSGQIEETRWQLGGACLNASSDAIAYVVGHYARLISAPVAEVLRHAPHAESLSEYRKWIEEQVNVLLFDPINVSRSLVPTGKVAERNRWHIGLQAATGGTLCAEADGVQGIDLEQLADGIEATFPQTFAWLEQHGDDWLERFATEPSFWRRRPLGVRLATFLRECLGTDPLALALIEYEYALQNVRPNARLFELGQPDGMNVVRNTGVVELNVRRDLLTYLDGHDGLRPELDETLETLLVVARPLIEEPSATEALMIPLTQEVGTLWRLLKQGKVSKITAVEHVGQSTLQSLHDACILIFVDAAD